MGLSTDGRLNFDLVDFLVLSPFKAINYAQWEARCCHSPEGSSPAFQGAGLGSNLE